MLRGDECIGVILVYRREVRAFDGDQVALVRFRAHVFGPEGGLSDLLRRSMKCLQLTQKKNSPCSLLC